jgi:hypothetical protein
MGGLAASALQCAELTSSRVQSGRMQHAHHASLWCAARSCDADAISIGSHNHKQLVTVLRHDTSTNLTFDLLPFLQVLLSHPGVKDLYKYEDGHTLDLAAMAGHKAMVQLLLKEEMPVGPSAMAHAAHYNHTEIMAVRGKLGSG